MSRKNNIDIKSINGHTNNKSILKTQQGFKSERHNVFTTETDKIALRSKDDKRMHSIDSIKIYEYGRNKGLEIKCSNVIK